VGIVHRSLRRPRLARRRALRNIGNRVGQGRRATSEPDPNIGPATVRRLENGGRLAFLHPLADQRRLLGANIAQLGAALAEDGNGVAVERVGRLEPQLDRVAPGAKHALHTPVTLALVLVRKVDADNGGGQVVHGRDVTFCPACRKVYPIQAYRRHDVNGAEMNDPRTWFQPKVVGLGWTPRTWEGWALIAAVIAVGALVGRLDF